MCDFSELNRIIAEQEGKLLRYAEHFLQSPEAAQDAVQDAFLRYIKYVRQDHADPVNNLSAWLFRATRNICFDVLKSARHRLENATDDEVCFGFSPDFPPDARAAERDDSALARRLIATCLSEREKEVLALKFEQHKSYREIAGIMELSESHVGVIIHTAIKKLRTEFRGQNGKGVKND